jgi:hypothetical protein
MRRPMESVAVALVLAIAMSSESFAQEVCPKGLRVKQLEQQEARLRQEAEMYRKVGMGLEYDEIIQRIHRVQNEIPVAYLEQGLTVFRLTREPSCALGAYNYITGMSLNVQPYTDGTWDLLSNGKVARQRITDADLLTLLNEAL